MPARSDRAAAAHLVDKEATPLVLGADDRLGANIRTSAYGRMFSSYEFNADSALRRCSDPGVGQAA